MLGWLLPKLQKVFRSDVTGVAKESYSSAAGVGAAAKSPTAESAQAPTKPMSAKFSFAPLPKQPRASLAQFATISHSTPAVALLVGDTEPSWYRAPSGHRHCSKTHKRRVYCQCCSGRGLCEHNKQKYKCKECKGASLCVHLNQKSKCKICKKDNTLGCGNGICMHDREKCRCNVCSPRFGQTVWCISINSESGALVRSEA